MPCEPGGHVINLTIEDDPTVVLLSVLEHLFPSVDWFGILPSGAIWRIGCHCLIGSTNSSSKWLWAGHTLAYVVRYKQNVMSVYKRYTDDYGEVNLKGHAYIIRRVTSKNAYIHACVLTLATSYKIALIVLEWLLSGSEVAPSDS